MNKANGIVTYIEKMREIQSILQTVINSEGIREFTVDELVCNFNQLKIIDNHDIFRSFLHLLSQIYENHHQFKVIQIIENILFFFKRDILRDFHNSDIFSIFKNDKRILLFLLKSEILKFDKFLIRYLKNDKYSTFFYHEIKNYLDKEEKTSIEPQIPDDFLEKRQICENDSNLCKMIRNDQIEEFIQYISETNCSLSSTISESIFETNNFLIGKKPSLIEYAAFFGSIQIFKYIFYNLDYRFDESLWLYAIHSNNPEILAMLEEKSIKPNNKKSAENFFKEAVQCHHNDIALYIQENYLENDKEYNEDEIDHNFNVNDMLIIYFKSYNFDFIESDFINCSNFIDLCHYDYTFFVKNLIDSVNSDTLNKKTIKTLKKNDNCFESVEETILSDAVVNNYSEIIEILLTNENIDVNYSYKKVDTIELDSNFFLPILIASLISFLMMLFWSYFFTFAISIFLFLVIAIMAFIYDGGNYPVSLATYFNIISLSPESCEYLNQKNTVLHKACLIGNAKIVKILISKPNIDVNAIFRRNSYGSQDDTALTIALETDNEEIVKFLLSNPNIDVNFAQKYHYYKEIDRIYIFIIAIIVILSNKYAFLLAFIIFCYEYFDTLKSLMKFLLIQIIALSMLWLLFKMLSYKFNIIKAFTNKISINSISSFLNFIDYLLLIIFLIELLSTLTCHWYTIKSPLYLAIENNNVECVKYLLENENIDVNSFTKIKKLNFINNSTHWYDSFREEYINKTALNMAVAKNNVEIVKLLLSQNKIDVNAKSKYTSITKKITFCFSSIIVYIIESAICSIFAFRSKKSSLIIAYINQNDEIFEMLLENKHIRVV